MTQKVLNLAQTRLFRSAASRALKAWVRSTQMSQWWATTLAKRVIRAFHIYRLRRKNKAKRKLIAMEMYRNETMRDLVALVQQRSAENRAERLMAAVAREEERLRTLGRTLAIWRERVIVRKSFRI